MFTTFKAIRNFYMWGKCAITYVVILNVPLTLISDGPTNRKSEERFIVPKNVKQYQYSIPYFCKNSNLRWKIRPG